MRCPACGEMSREGARSCAACGASLQSRDDAGTTLQAERRQITVVFCDLVHSTPLSVRLDLEELAEVIGAYQARVTAAVTEFGGYVARFVGDGVFSYFGWPKSEETNSELAVRAALAIVASMAAPIRQERLRVRVAVTTGTVVVGRTIRFGEREAAEAIGETPRLAALLQDVAASDSVVTDDVTRRQLEGLFTFADLGEVELTGYRAPVRAWRVLQERAVDDRFAARRAGRLAPLIARHEELARLLECWRLAKLGKGQLVWLGGEAGIGKSRLIAELLARVREEPHASKRYFCSAYHQASPLYPVISRFEYDAEFARGDGPTEKLAKFTHLLQQAGGSNEDAALLADLLGLPVGNDHPVLDLSPQAKKQRTHKALLCQVAAAARRTPLVLLAEDVHWADPSSLELLGGLIRLLPELPILLVVSFRPEFVPPFSGTTETRIDLARLGQYDAEQLAKEVTVGRVLPPLLLSRIIAQSDGVPLFIEELARSVLETGEVAASAASLSVPNTLQGLLTARLDRLPLAKRVAQIAATIGREFSRPLLGAAADIPEEELANGLDQLVDAGIAFRRRETPDAVYMFKHALVQEAIYDSVLRRQRAATHARIVTAAESDASLGVTEPGLLGYHCAQAGMLAKAASYYRIAGGRSAERAAVVETRTHLERGLEFAASLPGGPDRHRLEAELLIALGRILMAARGSNDPDARSAIERAVAVSRQLGSPEMLARSLYSLGIVAETRADLVEAEAVGEELSALAADSHDIGIEIAARVRLATLKYYRGQFAAARKHFAEALVLFEASSGEKLRDIAIAPDPQYSAAFISVALAHLGYIEQAISYGKSAVEAAQKLGMSSPAFPLILSIWARTLEILRDVGQCAAYSRKVVAVCEEQGFSSLLATGQCQLGWVLAMQGEIAKGKALLLEGIAASMEMGSRLRPEAGKFLLADVLALSGERDEALAMIDEILEFSRATGACWMDAELHRRKGELLLLTRACSDDAQAEHELWAAISIAREQSAKILELRATISLARLWSVRGRRTAALELLRPIDKWFGEQIASPDVREARELRAELDETPS